MTSATITVYTDPSAFSLVTTGVSTSSIPDQPDDTSDGSSLTIGPFTINASNIIFYNDGGYSVDDVSVNYLGVEDSPATITESGSTALSLYIGTAWSGGDTISLSVNGVSITTETPDGSSNPMFLGITDTVPITSVTLTDTTNPGDELDLVSSFSTADALCFLRGTQILTPTRQVAVEDLKIGDLVVTRFGGIRPIKWIGRQSYAARFIRTNVEKIPVCIRAGALADRQPARDLYVSPGHSMLVDGRLLLAKSLVNGITITQEWGPQDIHYYQIEFATHDCVIAEGAWAESYADAEGLRDQFHNVAEFEKLFPEYRPPQELTLCAPRPEHGIKLGTALRPVVARASASVTPGELRGFIDWTETPWRIHGWAQDRDHPDLPVLLEILLDQQVIGTVLACDLRADLVAAKIGRGRCGFLFHSPVRITPAEIHDLRVQRASDKTEIPMSQACAARISGPATAPDMRAAA